MNISSFMKSYFIYLPNELKNIIFNFVLNRYFIDNYCKKYRKLYENFKYKKCHIRQLRLNNNWFINIKNLPNALYSKIGDYVINEKEYISVLDIKKVKIFKIAGYSSVNSLGIYQYITPKLEELSLSIEQEIKKKREYLLIAFYKINNYFNKKEIKSEIYREFEYNKKSVFTLHPIKEYKIIKCKYFSILNY